MLRLIADLVPLTKINLYSPNSVMFLLLVLHSDELRYFIAVPYESQFKWLESEEKKP